MISRPWTRTARSLFLGTALELLAAAHLSPVGAQVTPDQMAEMILNSARKGYNEKNYPFAVMRFREFLAKFGGHKDANSARYGLALCLINGADRNYTEALQHLGPVAGNKALPEHPFAVYYTAYAQRGLGLNELALAVAKPQEAPQRRNTAKQRFGEAAGNFANAVKAFTDRVKVDDKVKELPADLEWAARARCDQAEMLLRLGRARRGRPPPPRSSRIACSTRAATAGWPSTTTASAACCKATI